MLRKGNNTGRNTPMEKFKQTIERTFLLVGILLTATQFSLSQSVAETTRKATSPTLIIDVWAENKMPGNAASEPEAEMPAKGDNVQRITNISRPTLSLFPAKFNDAPAVIVCPGGGYNYVTYNKEGAEVADWPNSPGITAL